MNLLLSGSAEEVKDFVPVLHDDGILRIVDRMLGMRIYAVLAGG